MLDQGSAKSIICMLNEVFCPLCSSSIENVSRQIKFALVMLEIGFVLCNPIINLQKTEQLGESPAIPPARNDLVGKNPRRFASPISDPQRAARFRSPLFHPGRSQFIIIML